MNPTTMNVAEPKPRNTEVEPRNSGKRKEPEARVMKGGKRSRGRPSGGGQGGGELADEGGSDPKEKGKMRASKGQCQGVRGTEDPRNKGETARSGVRVSYGGGGGPQRRGGKEEEEGTRQEQWARYGGG